MASLLLALLPVTGACRQYNAVPNSPGRAELFDMHFERVVGPDSMDSTSKAYEADLEAMRTLLPPGDAARNVRFRSVYCTSNRWENLARGLAYSDDALKRAQAIGDFGSQARAQFCRANFISMIHGSPRGLVELDTLVKMLENSPERQLLAEILMARGSALSDLGEQARALLDFQRARAAYRAAGIEREVDALLLETAITYRRIGDWDQAERYFTRSTATMEAKQNWERVNTNLIQLGYLYEQSGAPQKSLESFQRALDVATQHQLTFAMGSSRMGLAAAQIASGEFDAALTNLALARESFQANHDDRNNGMLALLAGQAMAGKGKPTEALAHYRAALGPIVHDGNQRYLAMLYQARASSEEALGHNAEALADFKRYSALQTQLQSKMRLEQSRLLEYEYEIRRRDFENRRLRTEAASRLQQVKALESVRRWQRLAILLGALLVMLLVWLAIRQWRKSRALRTLAMTDPLTGIATRRAIESLLDQKLLRAVQVEHPLCVLMLDLDHFKAINDRYGHPAGDRVLQHITGVWTHLLRVNDRIGRVGGEEFLILCPDIHLEQARPIAERLLEATRAQKLPFIDPALTIAVSIGIAEATLGESRESLVARADAALYRAKHNGRDRVES
ncbi:MAG: diguanylate cyclase [Thermomonas sp.]|uniref:tetratricopeptide repeat-containing diguanylate cyclase n=1 Tax=Thermomonas sp. TaxID=1971895 RepID=UPI00261A2A13|nr:diguanylate cyclase [Thermomonas sp.]MCC7095996.1 diguanylate cyclase [Thermomonas sp.]